MDKNVTSRDVAKAAGVSQSLVSLILNNVPDKKIKPETREHVMETARQLNYKINVNARNMKNRRAGAVGLLSSWDTHTFVFPPVIKGIQAVCAENDLGVVICTGKSGSHGLKDYINYYLQNRIDGLIYVSYVGVQYDGIIDELNKYGIPFVCIIGARDLQGVSCVDVNFIESGYMAVKHLGENGYKNIAYIQSGSLKELNYAAAERIAGCKKAADERGLKLSIIDLFGNSFDECSRISAAEGYLAKNCCDCIVATSYECFLILKAAARARINVPDVLGVISLDNELYAPYVFPSLTTIDEPLVEIARNAMNILLDKINRENICRKLEITPQLSVRESSNKKV